jgi:hypothetical protein
VELLGRLHRHLFLPNVEAAPLPLAGRKLQAHTEWGRDRE